MQELPVQYARLVETLFKELEDVTRNFSKIGE
jgi:hypothetical protein